MFKILQMPLHHMATVVFETLELPNYTYYRLWITKYVSCKVKNCDMAS